MYPVNDLKSQATIWEKNLAVSPRTGHMFLYFFKIPWERKKKGHFTV